MKAWPIVCLALIPLVGSAENRPAGNRFATRSEVLATHGMVATSQPPATQAGLSVLQQGGSAIDAAIAANAVLGLVEPHNCGVGGDLFALVWEAKTRRLYGLNASGRSPYTLSLQYFKDQALDKVPLRGPLPVSTPGCVDGWFELHRRFGRLPMKRLLAPAIEMARDGFPVAEIAAAEWQASARSCQDQPGFKRVFMPDGRAPLAGEIFRNPALARTYAKIAKGGRDAFYRGEIAQAIEAFMRSDAGFLTAKDLAAHKSEWVEPVSTRYRGYDVWELPPNTQGIAVLQMLNLLEGFDLRSYGFGSPEHLHLFIEAKKLAFEDRARFYADPDFSRIPVAQLISKPYAAERRKLIDLNHAASRYDPGLPGNEQGETTYLTAADEDGNMVSFIQSNFHGFGSGLVPDGLGFALQNRGHLFLLKAGRPNSYAPHKRPFHTIIPGFVTRDGQPFISFGVMGGDMQPQGHVQVLVNLIDFGMNLQEAGDAPRAQHFGSSSPTGELMTDGGRVSLETGFPDQTVRSLAERGHRVERGVGFGGYQAIRFDATNHVYHGASESRKDGQAAGY
jgi:gamma-glutamyltranspeptidase / glutathione hydrolase